MNGISIGTVIAIILSWSLNKGVLWMLIHGIFGWLSVFYYLINFS